MYRVRRYAELDEAERARLFAFTARHDPERFADQHAMERGYGSSAFEHGETQLSLWAGQEVLGAMAAVVRETALRGETFITAVAIEPEHAAGFGALLQQALATVDDAKREKLLQEATQVAMSDVGIVPLYHQENVWATRKGIVYTPRADERTFAFEFRGQ